MCGRFALTLPTEAIEALFDASAAPDLALPEGPRHNICPTQTIVTVVAHAGARHLAPMRWGFIPNWYKAPNDGPLLINARAETIAEKPAFRAAVRSRRCLIPASGFYEWTKAPDGGKDPWFIAPPEGTNSAVLALAGVWQSWTPPDGGARLVTCAIVTCAANATMSRIHKRMPVLIDPDDQALWLGEAGKGASALLHAPPEDALAPHRVGRAVNTMRAEGPELIVPLAAGGDR